MITSTGLLFAIGIANIVLTIVAAIIGSDKDLGFWGTLIVSFFFTAPVGVICAFISGSKSKATFFEKAVVDRLDKIMLELKKHESTIEESK